MAPRFILQAAPQPLPAPLRLPRTSRPRLRPCTSTSSAASPPGPYPCPLACCCTTRHRSPPRPGQAHRCDTHHTPFISHASLTRDSARSCTWHRSRAAAAAVGYQGTSCPSHATKRPESAVVAPARMCSSCRTPRSWLNSFSAGTFWRGAGATGNGQGIHNEGCATNIPADHKTRHSLTLGETAPLGVRGVQTG